MIVGKKANGYANLLTLSERKTKLNYIKKVYSKNPIKINSAIYELVQKNYLKVKTITINNMPREILNWKSAK